jgi:hypothetical protein
VGAAALIAASGCKRKNDTTSAPTPSVRAPADHIAKGEVPEGSERAFTLPLPLHSKVKARFAGSVHVASTHTQEELSNFVRARVKDGKSSAGATETQFDQVVVTKDPSKTLSIQIRSAPITEEYRSQMVIKDVTPAPEQPGTTDADRWRKAGLSPDGHLLDRQQRE